MRRPALPIALIALLLGSLLVPAPAAAQSDPAETVITVQIRSDGDARWTVATRFELSDANETEAFDHLRNEFLEGEATSTATVDMFRTAAARAGDRSGEDMRITSINRTARIEATNETSIGVLELSFTWTDFATVSNDSITVETAFEEGWFGDLSATQTLVIEPPEGYQVHSARPSTDVVEGALQWEGPQEFAPGQPSIEFVPAGGASPTDPGPTRPVRGIPWLYPAVVFAIVVIGGTVLLAWRGGYVDALIGGQEEEDEEEVIGEQEAEPAKDLERPEDEREPAEPTEPEPADVELLSDEERIERLLRAHDGRMKQATIVEETRWSNAKVSQLLSSMAEEKRVEKLRIGRENLISLPEYDDDEEGF